MSSTSLNQQLVYFNLQSSSAKQLTSKKQHSDYNQQNRSHLPNKRQPLAPLSLRSARSSETMLICYACNLEFPTENHFAKCQTKKKICQDCAHDKLKICRSHKCLSQSKLQSQQTNNQQQLNASERQRVKELMTFRVVKEKLLYVIGTPKSFADIELLSSEEFYGQFGDLERIVINHNPRNDGSFKSGSDNQQVAIYVHYRSSIQVAIAIKSLNGLRLVSPGNVTLRCSFGTSKYCANFLQNAHCDAFLDGKCPFIHYLERRRDKVIQDDIEFKEYLQLQDQIADQFCWALNLRTGFISPDFNRLYNRFQNTYSNDLLSWEISQGLPGPLDLWAKSMDYLLKIGKTMARQIEQLTILPNRYGNDPNSRLYIDLQTINQCQQSLMKERSSSILAEEQENEGCFQMKSVLQGFQKFDTSDQYKSQSVGLLCSQKANKSAKAFDQNKENQGPHHTSNRLNMVANNNPEDFVASKMTVLNYEPSSLVNNNNPEDDCSRTTTKMMVAQTEQKKLIAQSLKANLVPNKNKQSVKIDLFQNLSIEDRDAMLTCTWMADQVLSPLPNHHKKTILYKFDEDLQENKGKDIQELKTSFEVLTDVFQ